MTDDKPAVPPWLERRQGREHIYGSEPTYVPASPGFPAADGYDGHFGWEARPLPEWLAWRARVAEELGLEPLARDQVFADVGAPTIRKAIAAELRRLADGFDETSVDEAVARHTPQIGLDMAADRLRSRADELDGG